MSVSNTFSPLEERRIILTGITNGSTKTAIAQTIGKDKSTVGKEIKLHRSLTHKCKMPLECNNYRKCAFGRQCATNCPEYSPFRCYRRDRSPGACNGCSNWRHCRFDKYQYCPEDAQMDYRTTLIDSRQGVNLTVQEAKYMAAIISPLLKQGQSPYQIVTNHPERNISEKPLYNYIEGDVFHEVADITVMDLRRQVSRKMSKKKSKGYKKREDRTFLQGRTYQDYTQYIADNPDVFITQMDTVYMETDADGIRRTRVFYCDPRQSGQKGTPENTHIELRYILPKGTDLRNLGLLDQNALNLAVSHVDSAPVEKLGGRSPLDAAEFMYHDLYEKLTAFGLQNIEKDRVILKPYLLKK